MGNPANVRIKITPPKNSHASLADFSNVCSTLRSCLNHIGRCLGQPGAEFEISNLQMGSALVEVAQTGPGVEITDTFNRTIDSLQHGREIDKRLDFQAIKAFKGFNSVINKESIQISIGGTSLTASYVGNLELILEPQSPALGSVSGRLEAVSVHRGDKFTLYTTIAGEDVDCSFREELLPEVLRAVGRKVTAFGSLYYATTKIFPVRIDVESFQVEPEDDELDSLLDVENRLNLSHEASIEIQRKARDEWN